MSAPISARQTSARESSMQFETRILNMVSRLESTDSYFFYKRVTKTMATQVVRGPFAFALEFPIGFSRTHGKKFGKDVTFGMKDTERTWPIELTVRSSKHAKPRVFAYGSGGWKTFLMENQIKVGDILIFNLISFGQFQVVIGRAPVEVHPDDQGEDNEGEVDMDIEDEDDHDDKSPTKWFRNTSPWWNADQAPDTCRVCKVAPPCPRFVVTIRPLFDLRPSCLTVPGRFWELHGNMLQRADLLLRGPNKTLYRVKTKRLYENVEGEKKLWVYLTFGWDEFFLANSLQVGDVLEFFLVELSCFTVDLVERIED